MNRFLLLLTVSISLFISCQKDNSAPTPTTPSSVHLTLGNPSDAQTSNDMPNNYLMLKPQYVLSYNKSKGHANWVSWELSKSYLGSTERQNDFTPDTSLPSSWYQVVTSDYTNSGFDRGHLCPSADRTITTTDNSATFLMTNIIPQAPELNRQSWSYLENFCRDVVKDGYKAYIIAGTYGTGGEGSNGNATTIKNNINIPERIYKVIVLYPESGKIDDTAQVIAVDFPNSTSKTSEVSWLRFITTPSAIEKATSLKFFSNLSTTIQNSLKSKKFDYLNSGINVDATCRLYNGKPLYVGPKGGCYYINSNGNKSYVDRALCGCE